VTGGKPTTGERTGSVSHPTAPALRAYSVARQRELIVAEISAMTGLRALNPLDDADFRREPLHRSF